MNDMARGQYSLALLLVVVTGFCFALGFGIPTYHSVQTIPWDYSTAGVTIVACGLLASGLLLALFRR